MSDCVIGVDLGGTNVRAQAFDAEGKPVGSRFEHASRAQEGTELILDALATVIRQAVSSASVPCRGVGLSIPGIVDDAAGMVRWAPNFGYTDAHGVFHYWVDVPIRKPLEDKIGLKVHMGNDANLAALGEYQFGCGKNSAKTLVMLTLGTGIGGGVVMRSEGLQGSASGSLMLLGGNKGGVELGHIIIRAQGKDCTAGSYGALEAYCKRDTIIERATHKLRRGRKSILMDLVEGDLGNITPRLIKEACDQGDTVAIEVFRETGEDLGIGIGSMINVFAPDVFPIGGQIAKAGKFIIDPARDSAQAVAIPTLFDFCTIQEAEQIDDAGMLGGAALALQ